MSGQAGGHEGSFLFEEDKIYKRSKAPEIEFYDYIAATKDSEPLIGELAQIAPNYFGSVEREGNRYICIENLTQGYLHPCVMDVKLGRVTWTDTKSPEKQESQRQKVATTTTGTIGLRVSGLVVKDAQGTTLESWSKESGYFNVTAENIHEQFAKIVTKNGEVNRNAVQQCIEQTNRILDWFRRQRLRRFIAMSVLYIVGNEEEPRVQARLIDFAYPLDAQGQPDDNVIEGLENTIRIWERLLS